jgi:hypothetical protein
VAVAETVSLLGVDAKDRKAVVEKQVHERVVGTLKSDCGERRCGLRLA